MHRRIATITAAAVAAFLLATPVAWADAAPVVVDPWTGEVVDCWSEPWEAEPGVWDCTSVADAAAWGLDTPAEEPEDITPEDTVAPPEDDADESEPVDPEPEPEPVDIVEDNGDWGWSDAREMYRG